MRRAGDPAELELKPALHANACLTTGRPARVAQPQIQKMTLAGSKGTTTARLVEPLGSTLDVMA